jgi:hypothetical protein
MLQRIPWAADAPSADKSNLSLITVSTELMSQESWICFTRFALSLDLRVL